MQIGEVVEGFQVRKIWLQEDGKCGHVCFSQKAKFALIVGFPYIPTDDELRDHLRTHGPEAEVEFHAMVKAETEGSAEAVEDTL